MIDGVLISERDSRLCFRICILDLPFGSSIERASSVAAGLQLPQLAAAEAETRPDAHTVCSPVIRIHFATRIPSLTHSLPPSVVVWDMR